ncbi:MAG: ATP-binding protein, partial [Planctomycetes bacterium]|nr:ATP-binding protein [Planctomycetota bacterium]
MDLAFRLRLGAAACFVSLARRHRGVVRRLGRQPQLVAQRRVLPFQCRNADRQFINTRQQRRDQRVLLGHRQRGNIGHQTHQAVESRPRPQVNTTSQPAPAKPRRRCSAILPIAHPNRGVSKYSHLAIALGVEAVRAGRSVYFSPLADILDSLAKAEREGRL